MKAGQTVIGKMGKTGDGVTGVHLHFSIAVSKAGGMLYMNPLNFLKNYIK